MRVALLGGSFNPPHVGHLMAAYWVLASQPVDRVWLMPAFRHPFGKALTAFGHRLEMCRLAAQELGRVEVTGVESEVGGEGWTYETLEHLARARPDLELSLIVGSDIVLEREKWRRFDRILELARLIVVHRAGYDVPEAQGPVLAELSSTEVRRRLAAGEDGTGFVPASVAAYARRHQLY
jgi:nicotinate-nucleotide adenylyltransferase